MNPDVLVVGAGPTGLALATQLHAHGARVRIVERRVEAQESRAVVVQPRTLEVLEPLGVAETLVARGDPSARVHVHAAGRTGRVSLARPQLRGTAYPFLLSVPQATVEDVLRGHLAQWGVRVEQGLELVGLTQAPASVTAELRGRDGRTQHVEVAFVVGCDGADSTVRRLAGIPFRTRPYRSRLLLADVEVDGDLAPDTIQGFVGAAGICFFFPSPGAATWRLLTVHPERGGAPPDDAIEVPDLGLLQAVTDQFAGGRLHLRAATWATEIRLRRGQAPRYRERRILVAGDAAHVHSPAGAQGMNTGIQDAANLGWKLALVVRGVAPEVLLDSYEAERWPVARWTRRVTDLAFLVEAGHAPLVGWLRRRTAPLFLPLVDGRTVPSPAFRLLGGLLIRHRHSPAVEEGEPSLRGGVHAGDRLVNFRVVRDGTPRWLHELLRPPGFHVLLCGDPDAFAPGDVDELRRSSPVPLGIHHLARERVPAATQDPGGRLLRRLGVSDTAVYLVRPDGYVGYRCRGRHLHGLAGHLSRGVAAPAVTA